MIVNKKDRPKPRLTDHELDGLDQLKNDAYNRHSSWVQVPCGQIGCLIDEVRRHREKEKENMDFQQSKKTVHQPSLGRHLMRAVVTETFRKIYDNEELTTDPVVADQIIDRVLADMELPQSFLGAPIREQEVIGQLCNIKLAIENTNELLKQALELKRSE